MAERALMLVLHDVAPETWRDYQPFVARVDALGRIPITWLVVPDFHRRNPLRQYPDFCRMLASRLERGDELVLHGFHHADEGPAPRAPVDWFMRRVYTHEGEFYGRDQASARERLERGIELFRELGWPLHGFVAPAWLMSEGTRRALRDSGLSYSSAPGCLYRLPDFQRLPAPGLVWSARSGWRRGLSWLNSESARRRCAHSPGLRLGLHPVDMRHAFSRDYWLRVLRQELADGRQALTKFDWLRRQP
ncbi:DUF2334 domain-containing protein [Stutzerimonas kirkiae]|uniref:DUF2334 domain-containing protein n=1 Tax=Stutzerimonas kirkiae TaxID=2211392 RepID=UPI0010383451|nr:DUF2334 domain-containing protein [Stutzerimonas kirkiae]TBV10777.1 DUF2334 domain-containing protein [Stutzerimonas kirkiae]TBV14564.1 DUF2334 domain-containing protein [Stutzerimonas kirkiae]